MLWWFQEGGKRARKRRQGLLGYPFHLLYYLRHKHDHDAMLRTKFLLTKFKILSVLHKKRKFVASKTFMFTVCINTFIQLYWFVSNNKHSFTSSLSLSSPPITTSVGEVETPLIIVLA